MTSFSYHTVPNNECPTPCQSASCAETALLHCHPFKLQSRTECENEYVVQISRLWWNCAVFAVVLKACTKLTALNFDVNFCFELLAPFSSIGTHSNKSKMACCGRYPLDSLSDANNANKPFPDPLRDRC